MVWPLRSAPGHKLFCLSVKPSAFLFSLFFMNSVQDNHKKKGENKKTRGWILFCCMGFAPELESSVKQT